MGRHGGGSRGGGRSGGGRSGGGGGRSGGRGSSTRGSTKPFAGCYNRSYYDRRGRLHRYYTTNYNIGISQKPVKTSILNLLIIIFTAILFLSAILIYFIHVGKKVNGDESRIYIEDNVNVLTDSEEARLTELFEEVYDKSGMPVALVTIDLSWRENYSSLEILSEELYYLDGLDESSMIILYSCGNADGFDDWEYDMYCGDDTIDCLSDAAFDRLLDKFHKGLQGNMGLCDSLFYGWEAIMDDLATTSFDVLATPYLIIIVFLFGTSIYSCILDIKRSKEAYEYFKAHPEMLNPMPMNAHEAKMPLYLPQCPNCCAPNRENKSTCSYCGSRLEDRGGKKHGK